MSIGSIEFHSIELLSFIFEIRQNYTIAFLKIIWQNKFVESVVFLPGTIKSINPIRKYPHSIESFSCTRKIFAFYVFVPNKFLNLLSSMFNTKIIKINDSFLWQNKAIQCIPASLYSSRFITYTPSFIF